MTNDKTTIRNGCKEWYCKHGVGHYVEAVKEGASLVHGCDGCCVEYKKEMTNDKQREWREELVRRMDYREKDSFYGKTGYGDYKVDEVDLENFIEALLDKTRKEVAEEIQAELFKRQVHARQFDGEILVIGKGHVFSVIDKYLKD